MTSHISRARKSIGTEKTNLLVITCELCSKQAEHIHHKDLNHKNNIESNLQPLCTLCHAKIHGIEPRISELKRLIILYSRTQKIRIAYENQLRGFLGIELVTPKALQEILDSVKKQEKQFEKDIVGYLKEHSYHEKPHKNFPSLTYLLSIKGISYLTAGKILAYIDINKSPMVSSLWAYAGQTPESKKIKGKKSNWNQELKKICYQISDSFIKQRTPKYREVYDIEKAKQIKLLEDKKSRPSSETHELVAPSSKGHADMRARRKAIKAFLKDYWIHCKGLEDSASLKTDIGISSSPYLANSHTIGRSV